MATETTIPGSDGSTTVVTPSTTPPAAEKKDEQAPDAGTPTDAAKEALSQADIDAAIEKRLAREKAKHADESAALKKLIEERDSILASYRDKEESQKREQEEKERKRLEERGEFEKLLQIEKKNYEEHLKKLEEQNAKIKAEADAEKKLREEARIDSALLTEAAKLAFDPDDVVALIKRKHRVVVDPSTDRITVDGDTATTPEQLVREFLNQKPHLAKSQFSGKAGAGSSAQPPSAPFSFSLDDLRKPEFLAAHEAEIRDALKRQKAELGA